MDLVLHSEAYLGLVPRYVRDGCASMHTRDMGIHLVELHIIKYYIYLRVLLFREM